MSDESQDQIITEELLKHAQQLIGIEFTHKELEQMVKTVNDQLGHYQAIREADLSNDVPIALRFDPRLPNHLSKPQSIDRVITISGSTEPVERPANLKDVAFWPVTRLAELVRTRQVTSVELTEMYLARLKYYNHYLECVVTFTDDLAMQQAQQADAEIAAGNYRGPLHGIPWGAKDLLAVQGYPTTWGAAPYRQQVIDMNATVYERLTEAGAVLIAKLTLGALAYGDIWFDGRTNNPWDLSEGSSGSSAGSAAAIAAGLVGFAIGTETLGSIVSPSTRCGVTGLRPTFGRVSRYGAMALSWSMDKIGPMARTVEDCAVIFNAIYGPDDHDTHVIDAPFTWDPTLAPQSLRVGYFKRAFDVSRDRKEDEPVWDDKTNDAAVLDVMRSLGFDLLEIDLPAINSDPLFVILVAEAAAAFDQLTRENLDDQMQWQEDNAWPNTFRSARFIPAVEYINANRIRTTLMRQMAAIMQNVDVFVTPSFQENILTITNLTGHPCVVLPNGYTDKGTKTSISFIGGLFKEAETLAVAKAYQDATDFHQQHPPMNYESQNQD